MQFNWPFTIIRHAIKNAMGITNNDWIVFDLVYYLQTQPRHTKGGYCAASYSEIEDAIGIPKGTLAGIFDRGVLNGFIEINPETNRQRKTTAKWYDYAYEKEPSADFIDFVRDLNVRKSNAIVRNSNGERSEVERYRSETKRHLISNVSKEINKENNENEVFAEEAQIIEVTIEDQAVEVLDFFNNFLGREISTNRSGRGSKNFGWVLKLLKKGYTVEDLTDVVILKHAEWGKDRKMAKYLQPSTLFNHHGEEYADKVIEARKNPEARRILEEARNEQNRRNGSLATDGVEAVEMVETLANF